MCRVKRIHFKPLGSFAALSNSAWPEKVEQWGAAIGAKSAVWVKRLDGGVTMSLNYWLPE